MSDDMSNQPINPYNVRDKVLEDAAKNIANGDKTAGAKPWVRNVLAEIEKEARERKVAKTDQKKVLDQIRDVSDMGHIRNTQQQGQVTEEDLKTAREINARNRAAQGKAELTKVIAEQPILLDRSK